jgi:CRP-like cAMP-binding protein
MKDLKLGKIYKDGEVIFHEGEEGDLMYVIQSGKVRVTKISENEETTLAVLGDGDILGEMALFDRKPRSATAIAHGEARILSIDKKKLFSTVKRDPTTVFKIIESMSSRIRSIDERLSALSSTQEQEGGDFSQSVIFKQLLREFSSAFPDDQITLIVTKRGGRIKIAASTEDNIEAEALRQTKGITKILSGSEGYIGDEAKESGNGKGKIISAPMPNDLGLLGLVYIVKAKGAFNIDDLDRLRQLSGMSAVAVFQGIMLTRLMAAARSTVDGEISRS